MKRISAIFAFCVICFVGPACASNISLDGVLRDPSGAPLGHTQVTLQNGQGQIVKTTNTDAQGHYAFTSLQTASYVLLAVQKDAILASAAVKITRGETTHKDLTIEDKPAMSVVIAPRPEPMRNAPSRQTGTNIYRLDRKAIDALPQGSNTALDKVLLQTPGVAEDSAASGALHIRGEHANLQYRLNGILLPDGVSGFGNAIDLHTIERATLLDGALPAQYGGRTAAVLDMTTKNGFSDSNAVSMMGGSNGTLQPSISYSGRTGDADYFLTASHLSSDLGIENPTRAANAIHDHTEQDKEFAYASAMLNSRQRLDLIAGNALSFFQIPNNPDQATAGYQLDGSTNFDSASLNERQFESNQFATIAWQGDADGLDVQIAPFIRHSEVHFRPDITGDLMFNGVASDVQKTDLSSGLQNDNSWKLNREHLLRAGFILQNDHIENDSTSFALLTSGGTPLTDGSGNNIVSSPILNNATKDGQLYGVYLQDEWKLTDRLTMNYGARFDQIEAYVSANQLSPRLNFVYQATESTVFHAGYARTFTPPPIELVSNATLGSFANTTNAPTVTQNDPVKPERAHNFDVGVSQKIGDHWGFGLDGYYKMVTDLLDEGQFGAAPILTPFNYAHGHIYGSEFTVTYTDDKFNAYANFAYSRAMGKNVVSAQFNFSDPAELAFIRDHYVHLDHDQTYTASGGMSYDVCDGTTLGLAGHLGSGLRRGFANTEHLPAYATFDLSVNQKIPLFHDDETDLRFTVVNVADASYQLRDGSGIGVGAPQWGARRGLFVTLTQKF